MNGYAASQMSPSHEEKFSLMEEKSYSDGDSESGRADLESRFSAKQVTSLVACSLRFSSWSSAIFRTGVFLLPSFVQHRFTRERMRTEKLRPTAYLDGMRGLASLFVFFCHFFYTSFAIGEGWGRYEANYQIWKLPFLRLLFSGPSMVCLFFIISGYALSLKPLQQMRSRSFEGFSNTMTSFVFRRFFRLFLPTAISTFMVVILLQLGVYENTRDFANDQNFMRYVVEYHASAEETFRDQLQHWFWEMFEFVHVWGWEKFGGSTGYDAHLWTIPVEYRASMMLFLVLFGLARLRTGVRFVCLGALMWFTLLSDRWEMLLFLAGMGLAEMDIIRGAHNPVPQTPEISLLPFEEKPTPRRPKQLANLWIGLSIVAMYLMSQPDAGTEGVYGWETLGSWVPEYFSDKYRFWQMWGSILFVFCVARSPPWQRVFNTPVVQYFGRISYAIYLMHGPVMHTAGYMIERWAWGITGTEGVQFNEGFILASLFNIPLVIWAADVFCRGIDVPTVRFTKWLESRCSV
jgi:peptidoglycan/LPS O-acetylase OafA/YrhL